MTQAHEYATKHREEFHKELIDWLKIPSISTDKRFAQDVKKAAEWLANDMRHIGLQHVAIMPTARHPIVYGEWLGAGESAPTILVYGHYDVQPAVMEDGWDNDPFDPVVKYDKIIARGASDDKGQVMAQMKAAESLITTNTCPVNLKYIIEGEEEIGSPNINAFINANKDLLKADICVISDTGIRSMDQPSITYGLRGLASMEVIVSGPKQDLHSGTGGILHNPTQAIAEIVAKLHNEDGTVAVPGFYDDVADVTDDERAILNRSDDSDAQWKEIMGDLPEWGESGYSKPERTGIRPTLEINGLSGGYAGEGFKTVIGAKAIAKISCRTVPNQSSQKITELVRDYILSIKPPTVNITINPLGHGEPAVTDYNHPAMQAAIRSFAYHWPDKEVLLGRGGGTIPVVADFQNILGVPVVLLGFGLPDSGAHGPNENFSLTMHDRAVDTIIQYMHEVSV